MATFDCKVWIISKTGKPLNAFECKSQRRYTEYHAQRKEHDVLFTSTYSIRQMVSQECKNKEYKILWTYKTV